LKTNKGTDAGVYGWGLRRGHSFILGFHTTLLQIEIYTIEACIMENTEKCYTWRNIYFLSDRQVAIISVDSFQINPELSGTAISLL